MHSLSKTPVTPETARRLVNELWPGHAITAFRELTDGFFNAAFALDLDDGRRMVLKVAPRAEVPVLRYERGMMHAEIAVLEIVRRHTTMPLPAVHHFDPAGRLIGSPFFVMGWIDGAALNTIRAEIPEPERHAIDRAIGGYLREMNEIRGACFGYIAPQGRRAATWREAFLGMLDDILADGQAIDVPLPLPYATIREQALRCAPALDEVREPRLVHWDLWDGNIFVDPATWRITGIIDFERALWGDPLMEYQFSRFETSADFDAGYGAMPLRTPGAIQRRILYSLYLGLIMTIECQYRQYESPEAEAWSRAQLDDALGRLDRQLAELGAAVM